ncbi:GntR family transcriptional regulator [Schaalia hyovaginalis]|uniref:GntR family transcriptional regulator n=1 Tax=Schaalia hyovaginalis TaxID=29316 RepID=UPI001F311DB5|nr:GntR family transcriptional regulator [Schaalia hyovaginalis]MCF2711519.1 GntR family transcriptional regulator [Schaalia hyovaginalis]
MDIIISNSSNKPIYEQIASRIRDAILSGELAPGQALPSIRALANDLKVSVITTKRAYADLETAGFIDSVQGKGSFVTGGSLELQREEALRTLESRLAAIVEDGAALGLDAKDLHEMIDLLAADAR